VEGMGITSAKGEYGRGKPGDASGMKPKWQHDMVGPMVAGRRGLMRMNMKTNLAIHACIWQVRMGTWWVGLCCIGLG
jgi:hypothetical protein